jgi:hypothetical protein
MDRANQPSSKPDLGANFHREIATCQNDVSQWAGHVGGKNLMFASTVVKNVILSFMILGLLWVRMLLWFEALS